MYVGIERKMRNGEVMYKSNTNPVNEKPNS